MTKEEILAKRIGRFPSAGSMTDRAIKRNVYVSMDEYAKSIAELAFDAGYALAAKHETNHPDDALTKEEFLAKYFPESQSQKQIEP